MAAQASIRVIKQFPFEGSTKLSGNRYHFTNSAPSDSTHWTTLSDAIVLAEKTIYRSSAQIVETIGYAAGSDVPVFSKTYSTAGTRATTSEGIGPLWICALVRYGTTQRTSKNHPVYLFNYFHMQGFDTTGTDFEKLNPTSSAAISSYANSWVSGFSDGTVNHIRCGPNGAVAQGALVEAHLTHRDFPN